MRTAYRVALATLLLVIGCSGGGRTGGSGGGDDSGGGGGGGGTPAAVDPRCEAVRPRVRSLYQAAQAAATQKPEPELAADLLAADVAMVMSDCAFDPDRVAPCAERASDAAELERTCLVPLDEEGAVDGDRFSS